jgi:hypothetical protein
MSSRDFLKGPENSGRMEVSDDEYIFPVKDERGERDERSKQDQADITLVQTTTLSLADLYRKAKKAGLITVGSKY